MYVLNTVYARPIVNHMQPLTSRNLVSRPTNLPSNLPLIHIPRTPPRLPELHITPPHITSPYITHPPRTAHTPTTRPWLLIVLNRARLRSPKWHQHTRCTHPAWPQTLEQSHTRTGGCGAPRSGPRRCTRRTAAIRAAAASRRREGGM